MMRALYTAIILLLASVPALGSTDLRAYVDARLPDLNAFVRIVTGYEATHLPRVEIRTPEEINRIYFGEHYNGQDKNCGTNEGRCAMAIAMQGVIFIGTNFRPGEDDYILVHELVHFQQFESGREFRCLSAQEPEAYATGDKFVELTGRGDKADPFTVWALSLCND